MDIANINSLLENESCGEFFDIEIIEETVSTNTLLKSMASNGAKEGKVIIAKKQTGGRGRMTKSFFSPADTGIYMSILLKPELKPDICVNLTAAAAVAVAQSIENLCGKYAQIKWVNDIYIDGKKVCGILAESAFLSEKQSYVVLGIGINAKKPNEGFPDDIKEIAGYVFDNCDERQKEMLCFNVLKNIYLEYMHLDTKPFLNEYKKRSFIIGKDITLLHAGEERDAHVLGIDDDFHLIVKYENGETESVSSGEISTKIRK